MDSYEEDISLASSVLMADGDAYHKTLSSAAWAVIVAHNMCIVALFASPVIIYELSTSPCFHMYLTHFTIWCLVFLTSCGLNYHHNIFKRYGYLDFHRKTQQLIKLPFLVLSFGNATLLALSAIFHKFCSDDNKCPSSSPLHCEHYLFFVFIAEFLVLPFILIKYLRIVIKFCQDENVPDVHHDEVLINCLHSHSPPNEIGYRDGDFSEEMLERQADMIRYLKQHNIHLSRKILKLTTQLNIQQHPIL